MFYGKALSSFSIGTRINLHMILFKSDFSVRTYPFMDPLKTLMMEKKTKKKI